MCPQCLLVDPYAETAEMPVATSRSLTVSPAWEREQIIEHLGAQYQVVREIGRGGMGVVFLARDIALHRLVAIKVLRHEFAPSEEYRERFRREARMTARLSHPNIVPVHTFGESGELVYIVMKYVHGQSLADRMRRDRKLPVAEVQRVLRDLADALDSAHGDGVVHRDLKPDNILLENGTGRALLTDFGVALLRSLDPVRSDAARAFGTPHYMSPEQASGELDIDGRSDIYSLGVLGYQMLSGRLPFDAPTFEALAAQHILAAPAPVADLTRGVPDDLAAIIHRCLAKERNARYHTGGDFARAVENVSVRRRWFRRPSAGRTVFAAKVAAVLALVTALLSAAANGSPAEHPQNKGVVRASRPG